MTLSFPSNQAATEPMRVALISVHGDPLLGLGSEEAGGQNVYVREIARALSEQGHLVDVFTRGRDCAETEVHPMGAVRVIRLPAGPRGFLSRNHLWPHLPEFTRHLLAFVRWADLGYQVLHSNYWLSGWVGMRLAARWGIPHVHTHHSLGAVKYTAEGRSPLLGKSRLSVEDSLMARCDRVIVTSPQEADNIRRHYRSVGRFSLIPCGVNERVFHPVDRMAARAALGLPAEASVLGYVGRFDPNKGIDTLLRAAAELAERTPLHLVFAGGYDPQAADGLEFERISRMTEALGLRATSTFLGKVAPERLPLVYSGSDVVVVPSHYESFGLVAIESMGCGTPVVASRVGGLQYTVAHGESGLLVTPRDATAFARGCEQLIRDPALRERLGREALRRVQVSFTWSSVAGQLAALYRSLARARARRVQA